MQDAQTQVKSTRGSLKLRTKALIRGQPELFDKMRQKYLLCSAYDLLASGTGGVATGGTKRCAGCSASLLQRTRMHRVSTRQASRHCGAGPLAPTDVTACSCYPKSSAAHLCTKIDLAVTWRKLSPFHSIFLTQLCSYFKETPACACVRKVLVRHGLSP